MAVSTQQERDAFLWMQGRLIELLIHHDVTRFDATFTERKTDEVLVDPRLEQYRKLAALFHLRKDLFESILPRIKRRLSFAAPREVQIEEMPTRGRVDWNRTAAASWRDRPGEMPLEAHTRQRRRHFATPENILTVATLLQYREAVQQVLDAEIVRDDAHAFRHPLNEIVDACTRELAFPQFASLLSEADNVVTGYANTSVEDVEHAVADHLVPGRNTAYDDLLTWRRKLAALQLLDRSTEQALEPALGAEPSHDNYLYQLWLFYEMGDLLQRQGRLASWNYANMMLTFSWGEGTDQRMYSMQHDRSIPGHLKYWQQAPGVRPDFYIARLDPQIVKDLDGTILWREPGYVLDAKYYKPRTSPNAPSSPVKRMVADLHLTGERQGALLFAFQYDAITDNHVTDDELEPDVATQAQRQEPLYQIRPIKERSQPITPDVTIDVWRIEPAPAEDIAPLQKTLVAILDRAHIALLNRVEALCRGVFLDALSVVEQPLLVDRAGINLVDEADELLLCPKPHVGAWRVDIVSRQRHCLQDPSVCHIIARPDRRKPVRPPRNAADLLKELQQLFSDREAIDDDDVSMIARQVEAVTRRFAEIAGVYRNLEMYFNRVRDQGMDQTLHLLNRTEQESLGLATFLVDQLESINAQDFSGPAIHISSVMEIEVQRRIFSCPGLEGTAANPKKQTLGTLPFMRRRPDLSEGDWDRIVAYAEQHWNGHMDPDHPHNNISFDEFVKALDQIGQLRNRAAHTHPLSRDDYRTLLKITCQAGPLRIGALNALLLCWH